LVVPCLLDTVAFSFDLRQQAFHFVPIEGIGNVPTDIDVRHFELGWIFSCVKDFGGVGTERIGTFRRW